MAGWRNGRRRGFKIPRGENPVRVRVPLRPLLFSPFMIIAISIIGGLIALVIGADALVRGSSQLAFIMGIPPLIIGLTVVAFGTSAPELAVSVGAAIAGEAGVGLGNVFGSNIVNVLLILGLSAIITPLIVSRQLIKFDVPIMILVSVAAMLMAWDGAYTRFDGAILVIGLACYMTLQLYLVRRGDGTLKDLTAESDETLASSETMADGQAKSSAKSIGTAILQCIIGLGGLVVGAHFLVNGAVDLATRLGVSEEVVGLTVVAIGTSLPEIVTSIVAATRGQRDLAVGNVVGSNLFNLMVVLGISSIIAPQPIEVAQSLLRFDLPVMLAAAVICFPIFASGAVISRKEGAILFVAFLLYNGYQLYSLQPVVIGQP